LASRNNWNRKQKFSFLVKIFKIFVTLLIYYYDVGLEVFGFARSCRLCYVMLCVSGFWGLRPQTSTGALPLDPVGGLPSPHPFFVTLLSKFLATPLHRVMYFCRNITPIGI